MKLLLKFDVVSMTLTSLSSSCRGYKYSDLAARSKRAFVTVMVVVWIEAVLTLSCIWA